MSDTYVTYTRRMVKKFRWSKSRIVYIRVRGVYEHVESFVLKESLNELDTWNRKGVQNSGILMESDVHSVNWNL
jgi:hypothetical protein